MSGRSDEDITALLTDLVSTLRELETEVEPTTESGLPVRRHRRNCCALRAT
ncbi:hypothetical protein ACFQL1_19130 [Halomicroarcula sp. GCM10025709]|uniref:hypothetical protein n=1 Tax=Halomicroarcula sp. GCM10025709 TaxID=3252669 RepID=UPI00360EF8B3